MSLSERLHQYFTHRSDWYYHWHRKKWSNILHWTIVFITFFAVIGLSLYFQKQSQSIDYGQESFFGNYKFKLKLLSNQSTFTTSSPNLLKFVLTDKDNQSYSAREKIQFSLNTDSKDGYFFNNNLNETIKTILLEKDQNQFEINYINFTEGQHTINVLFENRKFFSKKIEFISNQNTSQTLKLNQNTYEVNSQPVDIGFSLINSSENLALSNYQIFLISENESILAQPSSISEGMINFKLISTKPEEFEILLFNKSENTFSRSQEKIIFSSGKPVTLITGGFDLETVEVDQQIKLELTWLDQYSNQVKVDSHKLMFNYNKDDLLLNNLPLVNSGQDKYSQELLLSSEDNDIDVRFRTVGNKILTIYDPTYQISVSIGLTVQDKAFDFENSKIYLPAGFVIKERKMKVVTILTDNQNKPIPNHTVELLSNGADVEIYTLTAKSDSQGKSEFILRTKNSNPINLSAIDKNLGNKIISQIIIPIKSDNVFYQSLAQFRENTFFNNIFTVFSNIYLKGGLILILASVFFVLFFWLVSFIINLIQFMIDLFLIIFNHKNHLKWGRVVDSISGLPIYQAKVNLYRHSSKVKVSHTFTDKKGEFSFSVDPGQYRITVEKKGFIFPSNFYASINTTEKNLLYIDRYVGQEFVIMNQLQPINLNIPLTSEMENISFDIRFRYRLSLIVLKGQFYLNRLLMLLISVGLIGALIYLVLNPTDYFAKIYIIFYTLILIVYLIFKMILFKRKSFVYDSLTGRPIPYAVIRIKDLDFHMIRANVVSDLNGTFSIILPRGHYKIEVDYPGYEMSSHSWLHHRDVNNLPNHKINLSKKSFLHIEIAMKRKK